MQVHGGMGLTKKVLAEKIFRDANAQLPGRDDGEPQAGHGPSPDRRKCVEADL
jgi:hypothetical protein